jgi:hypothetical protein
MDQFMLQYKGQLFFRVLYVRKCCAGKIFSDGPLLFSSLSRLKEITTACPGRVKSKGKTSRKAKITHRQYLQKTVWFFRSKGDMAMIKKIPALHIADIFSNSKNKASISPPFLYKLSR